MGGQMVNLPQEPAEGGYQIREELVDEGNEHGGSVRQRHWIPLNSL